MLRLRFFSGFLLVGGGGGGIDLFPLPGIGNLISLSMVLSAAMVNIFRFEILLALNCNPFENVSLSVCPILKIVQTVELF